MYATLLAALAVLLQPPTPPAGQPGQPGRAGQPGATAGHDMSLDGTWTVVSFEKNGQAVPQATSMTVTVRNGVATFSGGDEKNHQKAMRIEFGPMNQIRVTEQDQGAGGAGTPGAGTAPGAAPGTRPGSPATEQAKSGVYVKTHDYFAICLEDNQAGTRPGAAPGTRPATERTPGAAPPAGAGTSAGFSSTLPHATPYCTVILKRSGGGAGTSPGSPR